MAHGKGKYKKRALASCFSGAVNLLSLYKQFISFQEVKSNNNSIELLCCITVRRGICGNFCKRMKE
jgi:hypothetical protein